MDETKDETKACNDFVPETYIYLAVLTYYSINFGFNMQKYTSCSFTLGHDILSVVKLGNPKIPDLFADSAYTAAHEY